MMRLAPTAAARFARGMAAPRFSVEAPTLRPSGIVASFSTSGGSSAAPRNSSMDEPSNESPVHSVYVHHVTKVVLQHLQEAKADWLVQHGLDRGLRLNSNGTAVLQFPSRNGFDSGRIWTTYDSASKQHWLCVYRGKLSGRFLLKDPSMHRQKSFTHLNEADQNIRHVVDEMVRKVGTL